MKEIRPGAYQWERNGGEGPVFDVVGGHAGRAALHPVNSEPAALARRRTPQLPELQKVHGDSGSCFTLQGGGEKLSGGCFLFPLCELPV